MQLGTGDEFVNGLWYGDGGTGKTTSLARMANLGPIIYVNAESGLKARPLKALGVKIENITVWPKQGEKVSFEGLEQLHIQMLQKLGAEKKDAKTPIGVVLDSITEVYKALLDDVVANSVVRSRNAGKDRDAFTVELRDYGHMTEQVRMLVRRFRDLPCHFAMAALMRREQDDDGAVTYQPAITPALQNDLIGWVDVVCQTSVQILGKDEEQYMGLFRPHGKFRGKDRLGALPKWLVDPGFDRVVAYAQDQMTRETDPVMKAAKAKADAAAEGGEETEDVA